VNEDAVREGWRRVELARHPERPHASDYIERMIGTFQELRGDRLVGDDPALIAGLGSWHGMTVMCFGQQKGRRQRDRVACNFGMMHPEGFRKAMRLARTASKLGLPILSIVDTPGAYPGAGAEERGIASAIGAAIMEWFRIETPVVAAIVGEGGSGGALGMAVADRVLMLENAIYSVASPEACASITWRDASFKQEAAQQMQLTAGSLLRHGIVDEVVPEPEGGAHVAADEAVRLLDTALLRHMLELRNQSRDVLMRRRHQRFRHIDRAHLAL
jgi:acetyl-CoA carboxylase carboxyl transferase subunit alpha